MEVLEEFVARLCKSVGCYFHLCNARLFSLKAANTDIKGRMGVFAYVLELRKTGRFRVDTWKKDIADRAIVDRGEVKPGLMWGCPGVSFFVKNSSTGEDYQITVKALRAILTQKRLRIKHRKFKK